jgi:AraC-like DNA-binding protein
MKLFRSIHIIPAILCATLFYACRQHSTSSLEQHRQYADSVYGEIKDLDVLRHIEDSLEKEDDHQSLIFLEKQLGKQLRNNSNFIEALDHHKEGLLYATMLKDTVEMIRANNNIATDFRRMGILDDAASNHYAALTLCEQYSDKTSFEAKKNRVTSLNGLGNVYLTMKDLATADSLFRLALEDEKILNSDVGQAINYANIGAIFEQQGKYDSAWVYYKKSMEYNRKGKSDLGISLCYTHFGQLHEKNRQWDKAISEYKNAYEMMEKSGDQWHWLESVIALANVNISKGDMNEAQRYIQQAQEIATNIHSLEHQAQVAELQYKMEEAKGNYHQALSYFKLRNKLNDSVGSPEELLHTQNYRVRYVNERHQNEMDAIKRTHKAEQGVLRITIIAIILALALAVTVIGILYHSWRVRSKRLKMLREEFSKAMQEGKKPETRFSDEENDFINKLVNQIYEDMQTGDISVEKLSKTMYISRSQLSRKVLNLTGMSTSDFVMQVRMGKARRLLEDTTTPITEVALKCGFNDPSYFTRMFKKTYDITPSQARKRSK